LNLVRAQKVGESRNNAIPHLATGACEIRSLDLDRDLDHYVNVLGLQLTGREEDAY
jgi:hypothetical protein